MDIPHPRVLLQSNLLLGAVALAAGLLAAWLGANHLRQRAATLEQEARQRYATAQYIVASRDVSKGQRIDASLLSIRSMPKAFAPVDALGPDSAGQLVGARAAVAIRRGTPVVQASLLPRALRESLSEQLPAGMRALTIQVDQLNAMSGRLEAGDSVDLYYSRLRGNGAILVPLMQRVLVLATGDVTQSQVQSRPEEQLPGDFSSVTLLVSAADAQRVVLAEQTGRITLVLRRREDETVLEARSLDSSDLMKSTVANHRPHSPRQTPMELLVGGSGGAPTRSWLLPGEGA